MTNKTPEFDFKDYQIKAMRTNSSLGNPVANMLHASMGLMTEVAELVDAYKRHLFYKTPLDMVNIKEEIGDVLWYIALGFYSAVPPEEVVERYYIGFRPVELREQSTSQEMALGMLGRLSDLAGDTFHSFIQEHHTVIFKNPDGSYDDWVQDFNDNLHCILHSLAYFADFHGVTLQEAADLNIVKLKKRYPDGFSEEAAIYRDKERECDHIKA